MTKRSPYRLKLRLNVLNHLGINLYSNVLVETVANSWDADAEQVWITIEESEGCITITGDGHGMNENEINGKFLTVRYRRHDKDEKSGCVTPKWKRPVISRKGIGKLSLSSIAREIRVFIIIEIKKAEREMIVGQLTDQGGKYITALQKILDELKRPAEQMEVIFILGRLPKEWKDPRTLERNVRALSEMKMRVVLDQELIDNDHRAYKEFISKRQHAGRLTRVLQSILKATL